MLMYTRHPRSQPSRTSCLGRPSARRQGFRSSGLPPSRVPPSQARAKATRPRPRLFQPRAERQPASAASGPGRAAPGLPDQGIPGNTSGGKCGLRVLQRAAVRLPPTPPSAPLPLTGFGTMLIWTCALERRCPQCRGGVGVGGNGIGACADGHVHGLYWCRSPLLRSITSVLDRTPPELLHEIILVDDGSEAPWTQGPLEEYLQLLPKVTLRRMPTRQGLMATRTEVSNLANAHFLVLLLLLLLLLLPPLPCSLLLN